MLCLLCNEFPISFILRCCLHVYLNSLYKDYKRLTGSSIPTPFGVIFQLRYVGSFVKLKLDSLYLSHSHTLHSLFCVETQQSLYSFILKLHLEYALLGLVVDSHKPELPIVYSCSVCTSLLSTLLLT